MSEDLRLFVAVPIIPKLRRKFFNLVNQLKLQGANVKWVAENNFHLTLKFMGDTPENRVREVSDAIGSALEGLNPVRLKFQGLGAFPSLKRPRVFWIGLESGHEQLASLAASIENALEPLGFERETRDFKSHLTIGRVRSPKGINHLTDEVKRLSAFEGGHMKLTAIHLMKSELTRQGPIYTVLKEYPLGKSGMDEEDPDENS